MKRLITLVTAITILHIHAIAQIPNPGFECSNTTDSSVCNWGTTFFTVILIDSNGVSHSDSIVYDQFQFNHITADAHSGNNAIEIRNAWNYTQNVGYIGYIESTPDSMFSPYHGNFILPTQPHTFNMYYKYFPVGGDSARAVLYVYDSIENIIGQADIVISAGASTYTLASATINYTGTTIPASARIEIYASTTQVHFGTQLIVDDLTFDAPMSTNNITTAQPNIYPNPAHNVLQLHNIKAQQITINNTLGQTVMTLPYNTPTVDIHNLPNGIYYLSIIQNNNKSKYKFIKQ